MFLAPGPPSIPGITAMLIYNDVYYTMIVGARSFSYPGNDDVFSKPDII